MLLMVKNKPIVTKVFMIFSLKINIQSHINPKNQLTPASRPKTIICRILPALFADDNADNLAVVVDIVVVPHYQ